MKLEKCPNCGSDVEIPIGYSHVNCKTPGCMMRGPICDDDGAKWNKLCLETRFGKASLATVPDGYLAVRIGILQPGDVWVNGLAADTWKSPRQSDGSYLIIEPIPVPATQESVLRKCLGTIRSAAAVANTMHHDSVCDAWRGLADEIIAVLPKSPSE